MPERNKSWAALIYSLHEIQHGALKLQGVTAARLKIEELYGNRKFYFVEFFFSSIILACELLAYAILELSLYISISAAFSTFVWQTFKKISLCLVVQINEIKIRSTHIIGAESVSYRRHTLVQFQFVNVPHRRKSGWFSHTSFPPIRVIYLFIFFSFTPWQSQLQIEMLMK